MENRFQLLLGGHQSLEVYTFQARGFFIYKGQWKAQCAKKKPEHPPPTPPSTRHKKKSKTVYAEHRVWKPPATQWRAEQPALYKAQAWQGGWLPIVTFNAPIYPWSSPCVCVCVCDVTSTLNRPAEEEKRTMRGVSQLRGISAVDFSSEGVSLHL